jgi:hypothetical protein
MTQIRRQQRLWGLAPRRRRQESAPARPVEPYHAYLTRFAVRPWVGAPLPSAEWLEHRFELYERYCLPSMQAQTRQDFEWLLFYDVAIGNAWVKRLESYAAAWPVIVPVPVAGPWGATAARDAVIHRLPPGTRTVLTSRLDNDDALAVDYTARLRAAASTISGGAVVFDWGFNLAAGEAYLQPLLRGPFVSMLSDVRGNRVTTVWDHEHESFDDAMLVLHLGPPCAWVQVVHGENLSNRIRGIRVPRRALRRGFAPLRLEDGEPERAAALLAGMLVAGADFVWSLVSDRARAGRAARFTGRLARLPLRGARPGA